MSGYGDLPKEQLTGSGKTGCFGRLGSHSDQEKTSSRSQDRPMESPAGGS